MSDINVYVDDQQMTVTNNPVIASGGVNEDYVVFTFSEEWDGFEKVACFYKDGEEENVVEMLIDQDNKALIPHEVTDEPGKFWFGVVGIKNDITYTSEVLWYDLRKGIYEKESRSATADIYVQMLELAQQIVEHLNNTPYVTYEEDGEFQLPIHTINDSAISNESTWSSAKLQEEFEGVIYTIDSGSCTCNKTYSEIMAILNEKIPKITIKHGASINYVDYAIKVLNMGLIISARTNEGKVTIEHSNDDTISVTFTVEDFQNDIDALESDVSTLKTNVNGMLGKTFEYSGTNAIMVDTSKYNHLFIITAQRILLITLSGLSPGVGIGFTPLVGENVIANIVSTGANTLTIAFDDTEISSFCYMLTE